MTAASEPVQTLCIVERMVQTLAFSSFVSFVSTGFVVARGAHPDLVETHILAYHLNATQSKAVKQEYNRGSVVRTIGFKLRSAPA